MGEPDVADAYRLGGSTLGAAVFDRAGDVGPLRPAQRPPAQDGHRLRPADAGLPAPVAAGEGPGGGGRWRLRQAGVPAALPEHVKADCRRNQTAQGRVPVPARATAADQPDRAAPGGRRAIAQSTAVLDDPATQSIPYRTTGSDGSTAMVELASGVALWYHGGPPRLPIRWVVIRYLAERRGPYALLCTDTAAEPLRILQWYLLRWQVEVTFEELRAHLGMETQRQWSERAIARTTPALFGLFSVVTLAADVLIEQRGAMAPQFGLLPAAPTLTVISPSAHSPWQ